MFEQYRLHFVHSFGFSSLSLFQVSRLEPSLSHAGHGPLISLFSSYLSLVVTITGANDWGPSSEDGKPPPSEALCSTLICWFPLVSLPCQPWSRRYTDYKLGGLPIS
ncbi:hypothetical protein [Phaffia rhodozyma]|uniref:Uncharacterized protein n=1 Tax=Phaffia rhodozyma TaxID=264483 RepID=A0A0F7SJJ0_PHARH|nr:hypothetical protein [Phaffia rhodozyma]